jgi:hypothetical protein
MAKNDVTNNRTATASINYEEVNFLLHYYDLKAANNEASPEREKYWQDYRNRKGGKPYKQGIFRKMLLADLEVALLLPDYKIDQVSSIELEHTSWKSHEAILLATEVEALMEYYNEILNGSLDSDGLRAAGTDLNPDRIRAIYHQPGRRRGRSINLCTGLGYSKTH